MKKLISLLLAFTMVFSLCVCTTVFADELIDVAVNKTVWCGGWYNVPSDSEHGGPNFAVDENDNNCFINGSDYAGEYGRGLIDGNNYLVVDLGESYKIDELVFNPSRPNQADWADVPSERDNFDVQFSNDENFAVYETVYSVTTAVERHADVTVTPTLTEKYRYIRFINTDNTEFFCMRYVKAYTSYTPIVVPDPEVELENVAVGATATSERNQFYSPSNITDGNYGNFWTNDATSTPIVVDLGKAYKIEQIFLYDRNDVYNWGENADVKFLFSNSADFSSDVYTVRGANVDGDGFVKCNIEDEGKTKAYQYVKVTGMNLFIIEMEVNVGPIEVADPVGDMFNVALGATATSDRNPGLAANITDGNYQNSWGNDGQGNPIVVDLGKAYKIEQIVIYDRNLGPDGQNWLENAAVKFQFSNTPDFSSDVYTVRGANIDDDGWFKCNIEDEGKTKAYQYVKVTGPTLFIIELHVNVGSIEVADPVGDMFNVALGATATSERNPELAANITDGNSQSYWLNDGQSNPIVVDLGKAYTIEQIMIYDRNDAYGYSENVDAKFLFSNSADFSSDVYAVKGANVDGDRFVKCNIEAEGKTKAYQYVKVTGSALYINELQVNVLNMSTVSVSSILADIYTTDAPLAKIGELASYNIIGNALYTKALEIADFNAYFTSLRAEFYPEPYTGTEDLVKNITKTITFDAFKNFTASALANYISTTSFVGMFDASVDTSIIQKDNFEKIFVASRDDSIVNFASLEKMLKATSGVYLMQDATNTSKANTLSVYGGILGLDLKKASDNGITLTEIARYIEGDSVKKVQDSYKTTLANLIEKKNNENNDTPSYGGGGGGGGGGSVQDKVSIEVENEPKTEPEAETTQKADDADDAKPAYNEIFADVPESHWAADAVYALVDKGVIADNQSNYRADDNVSRAEFLKLIVLALGMDMKGDEVYFDDATKADWYYPYIVAGYNKGIIKGLTESHFGANDAISREDAAVIAQRALGTISINKEDLAFADATDISDYAIDAIRAMADIKVITGFEDGTFRPKNNITRAEAAVLINRLSQQ